jgi:multicomponent Na+:H+ antiporter subunit C
MIAANEAVAAALFALGLHLVSTRRNLVKVVMGLSLMEDSTYLFVVTLAYRPGATSPVLTGLAHDQSAEMVAHGNAADPVLQNFCITAIVIGVAVTAVFLAIVVRVAQHHGTLDAARLRELRG